ncbi:hypothetical protein D3C86_1893530 [compost metagenome]
MQVCAQVHCFEMLFRIPGCTDTEISRGQLNIVHQIISLVHFRDLVDQFHCVLVSFRVRFERRLGFDGIAAQSQYVVNS